MSTKEDFNLEWVKQGQRAAYIRGAKDALIEVKRRLSRFSHRYGYKDAMSSDIVDVLISRTERGKWPPKETGDE